MGKTISVITGATGHIGYALLKELEKHGETIRILLRSDSNIFDGIPCEKIHGDITDTASLEAAFAGADVVYHLAGMIDVGNTNKDLIWKVNFEGTKNVVEACKKCGVRRLVYASSVDAMPVSCGTEFITERASYNPDEVEGIYAKSKAAATQYVLNSRNENFEPVVALPGACIGPYDFKVSSAGVMFRMIMKGRLPVSLGFGGYNFVDVRDVAKGMYSAAQTGRAGECYLFTGDRMTSDEIIGMIAKKSDRKGPGLKMPLWAAKIAAPLAEVFYKISGKTPLFTRLSIKIINYNCNFSYQKAAAELGYKPMSTEQSIADMVNWIRENEGQPIKKK